jgi:hypothetical protein
MRYVDSFSGVKRISTSKKSFVDVYFLTVVRALIPVLVSKAVESNFQPSVAFQSFLDPK